MYVLGTWTMMLYAPLLQSKMEGHKKTFLSHLLHHSGSTRIHNRKVIGPVKQFFFVKVSLSSYPSIYTYVVGAQKNHLIETVLLNTHNICFG